MDNSLEIPKIKNFTDLIVWQEAHKLVLDIYKITKLFPKAEIYSLTSQMCRCAVSISSNIAEGFSRKSIKEKTQFYYISKGSLTELQNQLIIAKDLTYIEEEIYKNLESQTILVHKLLNGLIRAIQT